jgi:hypothetical protein
MPTVASRSASRVDARFCALVQRAGELRAAQWDAYLRECRARRDEADGEAEAWRRLQTRLAAIEDEVSERSYPRA